MSLRIITLLLTLRTVLASNQPLEASPKIMTLLESERNVLISLKKYTTTMEKNIEEIKKYLDITWKIYNDPSVNYNEFLSHPINAHILMRRTVIDVDVLLDKSPFQNLETVITMMRQNGLLPKIDELELEVSGLVALQITYGLDSKALTQGYLKSSVYSNTPSVQAEQLTASDCSLIFNEYTKRKNLPMASEWQKIKNNLFQDDHSNQPKETMGEEELFEAEKSEKPVETKLVSTKISTSDPPPKSSSAATFIESESDLKIETVPATEFKPQFLFEEIPYKTESEQYMRLCRGERLRGLAIESELLCWKFVGNDPFYLLQPLKLEELSLDPFLCVIYDVINDTEIQIIQNLKANELKAAMGVMNNGTSHISSSRISFNAWFDSSKHPLTNRLNRRLEMITGLSTDEYEGSAEKLQIGNYATGGLYVPHYDFFTGPHKFAKSPKGFEMGDRLATFMYYLSDVPSGGATVFPLIGATVWPKKGSGVFWWNLKANGEQDKLTKHGACPVLYGSKWVGNRWIRSNGQMFRKKCNIEQDAIFHDI